MTEHREHLTIRRAGPFALLLAIAFLLVPVASGPVDPSKVVIALGANIAMIAIIASVLAFSGRLPRFVQLVPAIVAVATIALLRDATGIASGYDIILVACVAWVALRGDGLATIVVLAATCVALAVPLMTTSTPLLDEVRRAILVACTSVVVGWTTYSLVAQIRKLVRIDSETGLPNRVAALELLDRDRSLSRRNKTDLAIGLIVIDDFAHLHESLGESRMGRTLAAIGSSLMDCKRTSDSVARIEPDAFLAILPGCAPANILRALNRLVRDIVPHVNVSVSGQEWDHETWTMEDLPTVIGQMRATAHASLSPQN